MIIRDFSCICGCWFPVRSDVITMYSARIPALPELTLIWFVWAQSYFITVMSLYSKSWEETKSLCGENQVLHGFIEEEL